MGGYLHLNFHEAQRLHAAQWEFVTEQMQATEYRSQLEQGSWEGTKVSTWGRKGIGGTYIVALLWSGSSCSGRRRPDR